MTMMAIPTVSIALVWTKKQKMGEIEDERFRDHIATSSISVPVGNAFGCCVRTNAMFVALLSYGGNEMVPSLAMAMCLNFRNFQGCVVLRPTYLSCYRYTDMVLN